MNSAARSVFVFGVYLIGTAGLLTTAPNLLLGMVGIAPTTDPWIRVLGVVVGILGVYYVVAARADLSPLIRTTVCARTFAMVAFAALVALGWAPPRLIVFGVIDALGAAWTWMALRADAMRVPAAR